jgi:hypothetical protein
VLRAIGLQSKSNVDLNELANADPEVRGSINNIKEHRLQLLSNRSQRREEFLLQ